MRKTDGVAKLAPEPMEERFVTYEDFRMSLRRGDVSTMPSLFD